MDIFRPFPTGGCCTPELGLSLTSAEFNAMKRQVDSTTFNSLQSGPADDLTSQGNFFFDTTLESFNDCILDAVDTSLSVTETVSGACRTPEISLSPNPLIQASCVFQFICQLNMWNHGRCCLGPPEYPPGGFIFLISILRGYIFM